jgi:hypothetical protein
MMDKKIDSKFDSVKYRNEWKKQNMSQVRAAYASSFVAEFKQACSDLGVSQASVIREAMQQTIEKSKKASK